MLVEAILHKDRLERELAKISNDPFFDNLQPTYFTFRYNIDDSNWSKHQFVSIDKIYNIVGYLEASVDRNIRCVDNLVLVNFQHGWNPIFYSDLKEFIMRLFFRYNYNKINFSVNTDTRNEKIYDKFVSRYGGRVVGTFLKHRILQSGKIVDHKYYEIFKADFESKVRQLHPQEVRKYEGI